MRPQHSLDEKLEGERRGAGGVHTFFIDGGLILERLKSS
jgi:hypothetical protein